MKTDNIYIAKLLISTNIVFDGQLIDYYVGPGIKHMVYHKKVKYILIKTDDDIYSDESNIRVLDLNTKKRYSTELPFYRGKLFIGENFISFDSIYPDARRNLPKQKILKMGNYAIEELEKKEEERK